MIPLSLLAVVNAGFLPFEAPAQQLQIQELPYGAAIPADFRAGAFPAAIQTSAVPVADIRAAAPVQYIQQVQPLAQPVVALEKTIVKHVEVCILLIEFYRYCLR